MKIQVALRKVYGNELIYPVCEKAKLLAQLTGNKTFKMSDIEVIKRLGYQVEVVAEKGAL